MLNYQHETDLLDIVIQAPAAQQPSKAYVDGILQNVSVFILLISILLLMKQ